MIRHVETVLSQSVVKRRVWNEEEYERRDHSLSNALCKDFLVEQQVELTGQIELWIA